MTTNILIAALFLTGAAFAVATIVATLRAYWPAVMALRDAPDVQPQVQDILVTITEIRIGRAGKVLRPDFTGRSRVPAGGLRAAA
jgi:hypothetical protein